MARPIKNGQLLDTIVKSAKQIDRSVIARDMTDFIKKMPFSASEVETFYWAILRRMPAKTCVRCGRLRLEKFEGSVVLFLDAMRFVCEPCQFILAEKGQLDAGFKPPKERESDSVAQESRKNPEVSEV